MPKLCLRLILSNWQITCRKVGSIFDMPDGTENENAPNVIAEPYIKSVTNTVARNAGTSLMILLERILPKSGFR